jgi:hypothetical protein
MTGADMSFSVTGHGTLGPQRVRQIGAHNQCGHEGCPVKAPSWRVILGSWVVQAYVCARHLVWAVNLDLLAEPRGKAMGWEHGYPVGASRELRSTVVTACLPQIMRTEFDRVPDVSAQYPQARVNAGGEVGNVFCTG